MSARALSQLVVLGLIVLGVATVGCRYQSRRNAQIAVEDSLWSLTYELQYNAKEPLADDPLAKLSVGLPANRDHVEILKEETINRGLDANISESSRTGNRELVLTTEHGGTFNVTAEFDIRLSPKVPWESRQSMEHLTEVARDRYLRSEPDLFPVGNSGVQSVVRQIPRGESNPGELLQSLFDHCVNLGRPDADDPGIDVGWVLANKKASPLGKARAFVTLCRAARFPARLVTGFEFHQSEDALPHVWTEVFYGNRWVPFDPALGYAREMPAIFVPIARGRETIAVVRPTGSGSLAVEKYSIVGMPPAESVLNAEVRRPAQIFDLTRLPVEMHPILSLMLLLPLGALVTTVFRNVIGIRTFGTFAPALLAMSFIYADWVTGIVILVVVVLTALTGRSFLERLHLLMVPRLSIVLTLIILCLVFCVSLLDYLDWTHSGQAVLLPLVILTILTERFHVTTEEDGMPYAIQLVMGTVVVVSCCYILLRWDTIGQLLLIYPEAHFFTLAAFVLIGRYSGYRLSELWRFRDLAKANNL